MMRRSKIIKTFMAVSVLTLVCIIPGRGGRAEGQIRYDAEPLVMPGAEFALTGRSWLPRTSLTYGFISTTPDLGVATTKAAIAEAFAFWSAVSPLTFTEVSDCGFPFDSANCAVPDIRIQFAAGNHQDGYPFDGPFGVLAHAFYPPPNGSSAAGDMHFDDADAWSDTLPVSGIDLVTVATHEIGHALGLAHAENAQCPNAATGESSIMCPFYTGAQRFLAQDDIAAIQNIYGSATTCIDDLADPNFAKLSNLQCHVSRLMADIPIAGLPPSLTSALANKMKTALKRITDAQSACLGGNSTKARNTLRVMQRLMGNFQKQVDIRTAKGDISAIVAAELLTKSDIILQQVGIRLAAPSLCL